jgi:hypothetical protein
MSGMVAAVDRPVMGVTIPAEALRACEGGGA